MTDVELLEQHRGGDEGAFADLVRRHVGWVYGMARRRVGDAHLAEDVVQAVFVLLHRKSPRFPADAAMVTWLHRTTRYAASTADRGRKRRERLEARVAAMQAEASKEGEGAWEELAPVLDELIGKLGRSDREAVLLRYYRDMTYEEVGAQLGTGGEAARKRVERAVEKLRGLAAARGMVWPVAGLAACLGANIRVTPPAGLASSATGVATAEAGSALAGSAGVLAKGTVWAMAGLKANVAAVVLVGLFLGGGKVWMAYAGERSATKPQVTTAPARGPAAGGAQQYEKLAPFSSVRWRGRVPEVKVDETWYGWVSIDDVKVGDVVAFAEKTYKADEVERRIEEDLVEVMGRMGRPVKDVVKLELKALDSGAVIVIPEAAMTRENRQQVWRERQAREGR